MIESTSYALQLQSLVGDVVIYHQKLDEETVFRRRTKRPRSNEDLEASSSMVRERERRRQQQLEDRSKLLQERGNNLASKEKELEERRLSLLRRRTSCDERSRIVAEFERACHDFFSKNKARFMHPRTTHLEQETTGIQTSGVAKVNSAARVLCLC